MLSPDPASFLSSAAWLVLTCAGCGAPYNRSIHKSVPSADSPRVVPQIGVDINEYTVQTPSGRYAVFAHAVVDRTAHRVSRIGLEGTLGTPAVGDQIYRLVEQESRVSLVDLRTGAVSPVAPDRGKQILANAPEQAWVSSGLVRNDALASLSAEMRAEAETLLRVEAAAVVSIDQHAERLLTTTADRVCLWDMRELTRLGCAQRAYDDYSLFGGKIVVSSTVDGGSEKFAVVDALDEKANLRNENPMARAGRSLQLPCDLILSSETGENVFERDASKLFTLHDFGPDGWAIVLPDGRYKASAAPLPGLAFFAPDGRLYSEAERRALDQPELVARVLSSKPKHLHSCAF